MSDAPLRRSLAMRRWALADQPNQTRLSIRRHYGRDWAAVASGHGGAAERSEGFNTKDTKEEKARFGRWKFVEARGDWLGAKRAFVSFSSFVSFVFHSGLADRA